jgi:hypothetical protein
MGTYVLHEHTFPCQVGDDYTASVKQIWTGRAAQVVGKYGENVPAAVCCNACRTCVTTNLLALAAAAAGTVGYGVVRFARRLVKPA